VTTLLAPPRWDTSAIYDSLDGRDFQAASEAVGAGVARLRALFDEHGVRAAGERPVTAAEVAAVEAVLGNLEEQLVLQRRVGAYIYAKVSTDARDAQASSVRSQFQAATASLSPLLKRFDAWVAGLDLDELAARSPAAADHRFALAKAQAAAPHQMSEAEEDLASELGLTGGRAWAELHGQVTALLTATVPGAGDDGSAATLPMSAVRGLATSRNATLRRAAFEAEQGAWSSVAVPLASALNAFKGEANALNRRRGWHDSLEPALFTNNVDRRTLDAMQEAVVAALPDFARYNRAKARLLGGDEGAGLPWWDLIAPVGEGRSFTWAEATATVEQAFGTYSPKLAAFARRAVDEGWIDAEAREGKVGGAFCMPVEGDVSRVLLNFDGSFDSVQTLAHELGHGYHNTQLAGRTWIQRSTPMALAETASIFCETVMVQASGWPCSAPTSTGPRRWSSTSTAASCSSAPSATSASGAPCRPTASAS
jgi:oligoendopeptidase F